MIVPLLPPDPEAEARSRASLNDARVACGFAPLDEVELMARRLRLGAKLAHGEPWPRSPLRSRVRARAIVGARIAARVARIEALFAGDDSDLATM